MDTTTENIAPNPSAKETPAWVKTIVKFLKSCWINLIWPQLKNMLQQAWEALGRSLLNRDAEVRKPTASSITGLSKTNNQTREPDTFKIDSPYSGVKYIASKNATRINRVKDQILMKICGTAHNCSLAEAYTTAGLGSDTTECGVGWTDTAGFAVKYDPQGFWYIEFPPVENL